MPVFYSIRHCIPRIGWVENDLNRGMVEIHWESYSAGDDQLSCEGKVQPGVSEKDIWRTDWHCDSHCLSKYTLRTFVHKHRGTHRYKGIKVEWSSPKGGFCQAVISEWSPSEWDKDQTGANADRWEWWRVYTVYGFEEQLAKQGRGQRRKRGKRWVGGWRTQGERWNNENWWTAIIIKRSKESNRAKINLIYWSTKLTIHEFVNCHKTILSQLYLGKMPNIYRLLASQKWNFTASL